ncbi:MAG: hypothetical protein KatS3mg095_0260 [Candidatus Parcubacteria bacterium]|nr:MAG: hypothetical protein KatS3mg095_0260 [Candidatus Parcubacteria bacterium]
MVFKININKLITKPKNLVLTISPTNLTLIEVKKTKNKTKIVNKIEINENFFKDSFVIIRENFYQALNTIKQHYQSQPVNVILNVPKFFIQKFNIPNLENLKEKNIIENKIKEEIPINIDRYFWKFYVNPNIYENILVLFCEKEVLEVISNQLLINGFLPYKFQLFFSPILSFIKEKYALAFDKSYLVVILSNEILTTFTYENGSVVNILVESIASTNKQEILERLLNSSLRTATNPLDIIFNLSDESLNFDFLIGRDLKIIDISKELKLNPIEIASLAIVKKDIKDESLSNFDLNIYNLEKEINLYNLNNSLKLLIILSIFLGISLNSGLLLFENYLVKEKLKLNNEINSIKTYSYNTEKLKIILKNLKEFNNSFNNYQKLEILNYFKDYQIDNLQLQNGNLLIIIKEQDENKRNEILNYLKNNLKLNNIATESDLIKINIKNE